MDFIFDNRENNLSAFLDDYSLEAMSSRSDTSSNKDYGDVYRVSSRNLDTGYDDMVWQRVQRKY